MLVSFSANSVISQPKNKVPMILNKPIIASDQPAISVEIFTEIKSFGR